MTKYFKFITTFLIISILIFTFYKCKLFNNYLEDLIGFIIYIIIYLIQKLLIFRNKLYNNIIIVILESIIFCVYVNLFHSTRIFFKIIYKVNNLLKNENISAFIIITLLLAFLNILIYIMYMTINTFLKGTHKEN